MILYYNCNNPVPVIVSGHIKVSQVFVGVSLSDWSELGSHGPFKIAFNADKFNAIRVVYWNVVSHRLRLKDYKADDITHYAINQDGIKVNKEEYDRLYSLKLNEVGPTFIHRFWKNDMFLDECEWLATQEITFTPIDIVNVTFMTNSPIIHPRLALKQRRQLHEMFGDRYIERAVDDPRLAKRKAVKKIYD